MATLARAFRADHLHVTDLPYRFSSWGLDHPDNVRLWVNAEGRLMAWAVMQTPFWTIDYACRPDVEENLYPQLLAWADRRAQEILDTPSGRPAWFVNVFASQAGRMRALEEIGFASQANVGEDSWSKVLMQRSAQSLIADCALPAGLIIRPLDGRATSEIEAYVELHQTVFETRNMTVEWRARTVRQPDHVPALDLVAVTPEGRFAAYCIGWLDKTEQEASGQIEPLGVHPDFRGLGLGRAILSEALRRLHHHGAGKIYVETDNYRNAALELYESAGFRVIQDVLVYRKDYAGA